MAGARAFAAAWKESSSPLRFEASAVVVVVAGGLAKLCLRSGESR